MNVQVQFLDCNSNPLSARKILFQPVKIPEITGSWLTTGDSYQFTSSLNGVLSASVVANNYLVTIAAPLPATTSYLTVSETGSYVYSGSVKTGSAQDVFFDLFNLVKDPTSVKRLTLTPIWNYPFTLSSSIVALCSTSSVPVNGFSEFDMLVPGVYLCDALGKVDSTFYISVPNWQSTGSDAPKWNAKDLLIVKPSKGIPVKLYNGDNSFVLTVSASDSRYMRAVSASYYNTVECITSASYASLTAPVSGTLYFIYSEHSDGSRITEDGNWRITEDGQYRVVETI